MAPTIDEKATGFFVTNYIINMDRRPGNSAGYRMDDNLSNCMKAVGLAALASAAHAPELVQEAHKRYLSAIKLTNAALGSPVDVKKDSTLLAIMLLSVFETVTSGRQRSLSAWTNHINGAAAVIKVRGPEQLASIGGVRMFMQVTASLTVSCLEVGMALPEHILALNAQITRHADLSDPAWRYYETMMMLTNFRGHVRCGLISNPQEILARALEIDKAALAICANASCVYEYETVYTNADPGVIFAGYYHMYHDYMSASVWNGMRAIRLMLQEIIRDTLLKLHSSRPPFSTNEQYRAQYQASTNTLYQVQSNIIASVPQHLGYSPTKSTSGGVSGHSFPWSPFNSRVATPLHSLKSNSADPPMIRSLGGYGLPWAIYLAGSVDIATEPVQKWAIGTLQRIGRSMGIQQAIVLADKLNKKNTGV
ncbi:hypothetical protein HO133_001949 [Letharia lupina]|uniref:Uncharacterized protein n=1 Tax=Letharia lupina TaxID=560253 RepID=A0A8H6CEZ2_9LECA|nr:uncharacterized protein HO133_001949 [Letharia lupina]KAF6221981.1 hypothetical protein HO133_001949 [Letharia lupina]